MEQAPSWRFLLTTAVTTLFAKHFNLPIVPLVEGCDVSEESFDAKEVLFATHPARMSLTYLNCDLFFKRTDIKRSYRISQRICSFNLKAHNLGRVKVNYRLRDAIFSPALFRGEPFLYITKMVCLI